MSHSVKRDLIGGISLIGVGLFALVYSLQYETGTLRNMGTGMFPSLLSALLILVGCVLAAISWMDRSESDGEPIEIAYWDVLCVLMAILLFALTVERLGLVFAIMATVAMTSLPSKITWGGRLALGIAVSAICCTIFVVGLGMTIPVWPWSN